MHEEGPGEGLQAVTPQGQGDTNSHHRHIGFTGMLTSSASLFHEEVILELQGAVLDLE